MKLISVISPRVSIIGLPNTVMPSKMIYNRVSKPPQPTKRVHNIYRVTGSHRSTKGFHNRVTETRPTKMFHNGVTESSNLTYTGGIPQQLDTNVHGAVAAKMSIALLQQW